MNYFEIVIYYLLQYASQYGIIILSKLSKVSCPLLGKINLHAENVSSTSQDFKPIIFSNIVA